jgi:hypothetical protein
LRFGEVVKVVGATATIRDSKSRISTSAACPPNSLSVVECFWGDVAEKNGIEVAKIHAQFKGRRAAKDVDVTVPELSLKLARLFLVKLCSVLLDPQRPRQVLLVKESIMIGLQISPVHFLKLAGATMS